MSSCRECGRQFRLFFGASRPSENLIDEADQLLINTTNICEQCLKNKIKYTKTHCIFCGGKLNTSYVYTEGKYFCSTCHGKIMSHNIQAPSVMSEKSISQPLDEGVKKKQNNDIQKNINISSMSNKSKNKQISTCSSCGVNLIRSSVKYNGKIFCKNCYDNIRSKEKISSDKSTCAKCGSIFSGTTVKYHGKILCKKCYDKERHNISNSIHASCCSSCGKIFDGAIVKYKGNIICKNCYTTKRLQENIEMNKSQQKVGLCSVCDNITGEIFYGFNAIQIEMMKNKLKDKGINLLNLSNEESAKKIIELYGTQGAENFYDKLLISELVKRNNKNLHIKMCQKFDSISQKNMEIYKEDFDTHWLYYRNMIGLFSNAYLSTNNSELTIEKNPILSCSRWELEEEIVKFFGFNSEEDIFFYFRRLFDFDFEKIYEDEIDDDIFTDVYNVIESLNLSINVMEDLRRFFIYNINKIIPEISESGIVFYNFYKDVNMFQSYGVPEVDIDSLAAEFSASLMGEPTDENAPEYLFESFNYRFNKALDNLFDHISNYLYLFKDNSDNTNPVLLLEYIRVASGGILTKKVNELSLRCSNKFTKTGNLVLDLNNIISECIDIKDTATRCYIIKTVCENWNDIEYFNKLFDLYATIDFNLDNSKKESSSQRGINFEDKLFEYFVSQGYTVVKTPKTGDMGADLILEKGGVRSVVQAKCYTGSVGVKAIQEIFTAKNYYKAREAFVITNSTFTKNAIELAESNGVSLWDGDFLKMMGIL